MLQALVLACCVLAGGSYGSICNGKNAQCDPFGESDTAYLLQHYVKSATLRTINHASPPATLSHGNSSSTTFDLSSHLQHMMLQAKESFSIWSSALGRYITQPVPGTSADPGLDAWDSFDTTMVVAMCLALVMFDLCISDRMAYTLRNHMIVLFVMLVASTIFGLVVWKQRGNTDGIAWLTGYVVEWALSMDNLFVFHLVFKAFSVPNEQSTRALCVGIYGAIFFRVIFIAFLSELFELSHWVDVAVGAVLIVSGLMSLQDDDEPEVQDLKVVRFFKWLFGSRMQDRYNKEGYLFVRGERGEMQVTVLFLVICVISVVDVFFAVDSVGSKTGQIKNLYINVTSCLMAMFSLRSLFFIVKDMADYFDYVKYGICGILCFVGAEMILQRWWHVKLEHMCIIICFLFIGSVVASVIKVQISGANKSGEDAAIQKSEERGLPRDAATGCCPIFS
jgi:tellurite resistance protein TerC